jgi:altronate hydrolase
VSATTTTPAPLLVLSDTDNTAVALRDLEAGETLGDVVVAEPIRAGHKIAIAPIAAGGTVRKYGVDIGTADVAIAPGEHVHVHNVHSERMRGDR